MFNRTLAARFLPSAAIVTALSIGAAPARAQATAADPSLTAQAADPALKWGPCPPFMPKGCGIAVLHGDPAKPNVDVFLKVPGRSALPRHWHTSAERMILVAGQLRVHYDGQAPTVLATGSYAFGPARRPHDGTCESATPCILFIAFEAPLDAVAGEPKGN